MASRTLKIFVLWTLGGHFFVAAAVYVSYLSEREELTVRDHTPIPSAFQ